MTNQEWLQQNNAKIEKLQEKLANKVVAKGTIEITENGKHNVAGYSDANVNIQPNLTDKTVTENGTYNAIDEGFDGYLSVTVDVGEKQTVEIALPSEFAKTTAVYYVIVSDNKILLSSTNSSGLWLYTINSKSMVQIYTSNSGWQYFQQVTTNKWLICNTSNVLLYNLENDTCVRIYDNGWWQHFQQLTTNKWLLGSNFSSNGMLIYDSVDDSIVKINTSQVYPLCQQISDTKCLIGSSSGSSNKLLLYNSQDNSCVQICDVSGAWRSFNKVTDTKWLIGGASAKGILLYDSRDDRCVQIYDIGSYWEYFNNISEGRCLIASSQSSYKGILLYNSEYDSVTQIYTDGYYWCYAQQVSDTKCLISSYNSSTGILLYNLSDGSFTQIYSKESKWQHFQQASNTKWLIGSSSSVGILLYNLQDDSVTRIYSTMGKYDIFTPDTDNNYYISGSDKTTTPQTLYYTESTDTISLVGYYLGEI